MAPSSIVAGESGDGGGFSVPDFLTNPITWIIGGIVVAGIIVTGGGGAVVIIAV